MDRTCLKEEDLSPSLSLSFSLSLFLFLSHSLSFCLSNISFVTVMETDEGSRGHRDEGVVFQTDPSTNQLVFRDSNAVKRRRTTVYAD